jgi:hypothetical protein
MRRSCIQPSSYDASFVHVCAYLVTCASKRKHFCASADSHCHIKMPDRAADVFVSLQALHQTSTSFSSAKIELASLEPTSCSGCSRKISLTASDPDAICVAGCRCLMCPNWYACPDCAAEQSQAHRVSHVNHVTYCITRELERAALEDGVGRDPMSPFLFVARHFLTPLFKMSLPVLVDWAQVTTQRSSTSRHSLCNAIVVTFH